jgi:drug/metabolite transporter (DMT)-like permease
MSRAASALAVLALLGNAFCYGLSWWPFRHLQDLGVHPLWATVLVDALVLLVIVATAPRVLGQWRRSLALWPLLLAAGCTNVGFNWAVTIGDVVRVVLLFYLMPVWVALLAWPLLGERPTLRSVAYMLLALGGVVLVLKTPDSPWPWPHDLADGLALMGGFSFALTNLLLRRLRDADAMTMTATMLLGGTLLCALTAWVGMEQGLVPALPAPAAPWLLGALGLALMIGVGNVALQYGAARLQAHTTSVVLLCEVVFASVSAILLGAAVLTERVAMGGALIFTAALLSALSSPATHDSAPAKPATETP